MLRSLFDLFSAPPSKPAAKTQDNVIIGLGPTGLAFAIEAARKDTKKRKVVIITDRPDFTRNAIFRLDVDILDYLRELVGTEKVDELFTKNLIGPQESLNGFDFHVIQIKVFESLLFEALQKEKNIELIYLPRRGTGKISDIDQYQHIVHLQEQTEREINNRYIHFKFLIAADGAAHSIANKIGNIEYHHTQHPQIYNKHARVTYKLPEDICADKFRKLLADGNSNKPDNSVLQNMGWCLRSEPEARIFAIDNYLFVAAECPPELFEASQEVIDNWIRTVLNFRCENAAIEKLQKMESGIFEVDLMEANCTLRVLPSTPVSEDGFDDQRFTEESLSYFLQAGDALRTTHYQTGSGAVMGLREAKVFGELMASQQTIDDIIDYHSKIAMLRDENRARVDAFIDKRFGRESGDIARYCNGALRPPAGGVMPVGGSNSFVVDNLLTSKKRIASLYDHDADDESCQHPTFTKPRI